MYITGYYKYYQRLTSDTYVASKDIRRCEPRKDLKINGLSRDTITPLQQPTDTILN